MSDKPPLGKLPGKLSPFWELYHRLREWNDADGLPDPDKHDAAKWMSDMYHAITLAAANGDRHARSAFKIIEDPNSRFIYPIKPIKKENA
jgi:hypothetical protein